MWFFWLISAFTVGSFSGLLLGGWAASLKHAALEDEIRALQVRLVWRPPAGPDAWACTADSIAADSPHAEARRGSYHH